MRFMKHALTVFHCFVALIISIAGAIIANDLRNSQAIGFYFVSVVSILLPVVIATRVSWASGYERGFRDGAAMKQNSIPLAKVDA